MLVMSSIALLGPFLAFLTLSITFLALLAPLLFSLGWLLCGGCYFFLMLGSSVGIFFSGGFWVSLLNDLNGASGASGKH